MSQVDLKAIYDEDLGAWDFEFISQNAINWGHATIESGEEFNGSSFALEGRHLDAFLLSATQAKLVIQIDPN